MEYFFGIIFTWLITFFVYNNYKHKKKKPEYTNTDIDLNWTPAPLVEEAPENFTPFNPPLINSKVGKWVDIDGQKLLNFASHNYLGFVENSFIIEEAKKAIFKYGVGSCGPRGFYGTVDVHLELESRLAKFMRMEGAIVYSYGFTTIASAIAAYSKKHDVIFADEKVNFAIQRGIEASRSKVIFFKHNDLDDLERLLITWNDSHQDQKENAKIRKFLISEGLFLNTGKICPLPGLIQLRKKYQLRMFLDESISIGVLGQSGRGVIEHYDANPEDVDMVMASMEYALGTGGGFCVGSSFIVEHQRLSGLGYCFSASLPPFLAVAARAGIDVIEESGDLIYDLSNCCRQLHSALLKSNVLETCFKIDSDLLSPIKHLILRRNNSYKEDYCTLNEIVSYCKYRGILLTTAHYLVEKEHSSPPASIRLTTNINMTSADVCKLIQVLEEAVYEII